MISGSGHDRHRHARPRDKRRGRDTWNWRDRRDWRDTWNWRGTDSTPDTRDWRGTDSATYEPDPWDLHDADGARRGGGTRQFSARLIVPLAIPMALGLALGMVLALTGQPPVTRLDPSALRVQASPDAEQATHLAAAPATNACELIVPDRVLSAAGLATPWQLTGPDGQSPASSGCQQSNPDLQAFVQATILNPATGALYVYEPLVVTQGTLPAVAPVVPRLPAHAVVSIMVGFNGKNIRLAGAGSGTLADAKCTDGDGTSLFGQVSFCNGVAFLEAADSAIADGRLRIPANGDSPVTGRACPTARSFELADAEPSDSVTTQYLITATGQTAQDSPANRAALPGATAISRGSGDRLLDYFVLPVLGCVTFTAPDLSAGGAPGTSQALDDMFAAHNQRAPIALVPESDPMTMVDGSFSTWKTDLYRFGVGQPLVSEGLTAPFNQSKDGGQQADTPANYCANMLNIQTAFLHENAGRFAGVASPGPAGDNLFTFLAARLSDSFTSLRCASYGLKNTVTLTVNKDGVATAAVLSLTKQQPRSTASSPGPVSPVSVSTVPVPTVPAPAATAPEQTTPGQPQPQPSQTAPNPFGSQDPGGAPWWGSSQ